MLKINTDKQVKHFISSVICNTVHMFKNYHSLGKHLSFYVFIYFLRISYAMFCSYSRLFPHRILSDPPHPYSPKFMDFPSLKKKKMIPHQKKKRSTHT